MVCGGGGGCVTTDVTGMVTVCGGGGGCVTTEVITEVITCGGKVAVTVAGGRVTVEVKVVLKVVALHWMLFHSV